MALTAQRYRIRRRISQLRFLDSALLQPVCEVGRRRIVALRDELLGGPVGEQCLDFRTVLVQLALALTAQRYRIRRRISQLRFLDSAILQPVCEVGRRRIVALRDELLGGPVGEQCLDFRTVLVQLAFAGAFRPSDRQAGRPSRAKGFLRPRGDQPPLDLSGH